MSLKSEKLNELIIVVRVILFQPCTNVHFFCVYHKEDIGKEKKLPFVCTGPLAYLAVNG